jgi:hypothetical protein
MYFSPLRDPTIFKPLRRLQLIEPIEPIKCEAQNHAGSSVFIRPHEHIVDPVEIDHSTYHVEAAGSRLTIATASDWPVQSRARY